MMFVLPDFRDRVIGDCRTGLLPLTLSEIWDAHSGRVARENLDSGDLTPVGPGDFSADFVESLDGRVSIVIGAPAVRGCCEAAIVVAVVNGAPGHGSLRYFTCDSPLRRGAEWTVSEWLEDGLEVQRGAIADPTPAGLLRFTSSVTGFQPLTVHPASEAIRLVPTADTYVDLRRDDGADFTGLWADGPAVIARQTLGDLRRLAGNDGSALILNAETTSGLLLPVPSYVQFEWDGDELVVEVRADYAYWGLCIPSAGWSTLEACGLAKPNDARPNYNLVIPGWVDDEERLSILVGVFDAFLSVLRPTGPIVVTTIDG